MLKAICILHFHCHYIMNNYSYSDWLKIDLHIHTDWSKKTKDNDYKGVFDINQLKSKLIDNEVGIFSLTDHNIINIDAYRAYYNNYDSNKDPMLLVGVELDVIVNGADSEEIYHTLLIFDNPGLERAQELAKKLETFYKENGIDDKNRVVTFENIIDLFGKDRFFFIPHAGNTRSMPNAYKKSDIEEAQLMVILMDSALEKVKPEKIRIFNKGFDQLKSPEFRDQDDTAYIQFSDNHNASKYPCKGKDGTDHEFYYVKGSKSFETLRLAFIDPKSRIKSSSEYQDINTELNHIASLFIQGDPKIKDCTIHFSPHLNTFIGGRSTGKTLLMSILANKIDTVDSADFPYEVQYGNFQIRTNKDDKPKDLASVRPEELVFIRQNKIVGYFEKENLSELAKSTGKHELYEGLLKCFRNLKSKILVDLDELFTSLLNIQSANLKHQPIISTDDLKWATSKYYNLLMETDVEKEEGVYTKKLTEIQTNIDELQGALKKFKNHRELLFEDSELELVDQFEKLLQKKGEFSRLLKKRQKVKQVFLQEVHDLINSKNQDLKKESRLKSNANKSIQKLINDIGDNFELLAIIKHKSDKVESINYSNCEEIPLMEGIQLMMEVNQEKGQSIKDIALGRLLDYGSDESLYLNYLNVLLEKTTVKYKSNYNIHDLKNLVNKQLEKILWTKFDKPIDYLKYSDDENDTSRRRSPGYNAEKYLEIILKNPASKYIFIDQPEDNLGSKFITQSLVPLIRELKFQKQFFLVTHNPSIVVYGDAENVIIAKNDHNEMYYNQTVLEDSTAQKEICAALDGGEYVFKQRSKKYNIQTLKH